MMVERVKVIDAMADINIVGLIDSGTFLAGEFGRALRRSTYTLPIDHILLPDKDRTVFGAMSGNDDVCTFDPELCRTMGFNRNDVSMILRDSKLQLLKKSYGHEGCMLWLKRAQSIRKSTVLLVDAVMASKTKLETAINSLSAAEVSRIIPISLFFDRNIAKGTSLILEPGVHFHQTMGIESIKRSVAIAESLPESELLSRFEELANSSTAKL